MNHDYGWTEREAGEVPTRGLYAIPVQYYWVQPFLPTMALIPMRLALTFQGDDEHFAEVGVAVKIGGKYNHHYFELSHDYIY